MGSIGELISRFLPENILARSVPWAASRLVFVPGDRRPAQKLEDPPCGHLLALRGIDGE
jgi:hypothetical protein